MPPKGWNETRIRMRKMDLKVVGKIAPGEREDKKKDNIESTT